MAPLPEPSPDALHHSRELARLIHREIAAAGGWIAFSRYMELALYAPGLGYYSAGAAKFGAAGDFVTAPELSPLFGRTLARQVAQVLELTGGEVLELGAGSGRLALDLLRELERLGTLPVRYHILEVSADLRERQRALIGEAAPHLLERVAWLDTLPASFTGIILGNEVLDAMPAALVRWREDAVYERGVASAGDEFQWSERPLAPGPLLDAARALELPAGYLSEINLAAAALVASLARRLQSGALLLIDYGFGESEYYHPQRSQGTLMCHYRHHAHADPFFLPGLQDITAHADFSRIGRAGTAGGLELLGYATQAAFLINCGIAQLLSETPVEDVSTYLPLTNQAQRLLSPAEMGELFKVIALGKGIDEPLVGFAGGDRRHSL